MNDEVSRTHELTEVIAPRQEEYTGVVLLPVRTQEREHDAHEDVEIPLGSY